MKRFFGCHVSAAGGLANAIENGARLGVNAIQIHPSQPQRWNYKPFEPGIESEFLTAKKKSGIEKVFFHGVYLINLAVADKSKLGYSLRSLQYYLDLSERICGDGVIFHVGSNREQESEEAGFRQAAEAINTILDKSAGKSKLLLEVAAGSGSIIGDRMEELRSIYEMVEDKERVGFALDTQHMWASGYDLRAETDQIIKQIGDTLSFERVAAIHLNDSKTALSSRSDRHENLGEGAIGLAALSALVNDERLVSIPLLMETPGLRDPETAAAEVAKLKKLLQI